MWITRKVITYYSVNQEYEEEKERIFIRKTF
jgi:hypothetical protein